MFFILFLFQLFFPFIYRDCPSGYTKDERTGGCDDIDECEGTDVTCNLETQVCYNTIGSYKCLDIIPLPEANACPNGYQFDSKIKQCVGELFEIIIFPEYVFKNIVCRY